MKDKNGQEAGLHSERFRLYEDRKTRRGKGSGEGFGAASTSDYTVDLKKLQAGQQGALEQRLL